MGSWSEQQEVKKEVKEKEKTSRETLGKFFYDLAKYLYCISGRKCCFCCDTTRKSRKLGTYTYRYFVTYIFSYIGYKIIKQ